MTGRRRSQRLGLGPWLLLPGLALLAVFVFVPLVRVVILSLYGSDLLGNTDRFVGFSNYREHVVNHDFIMTVAVSLAIALIGMVVATFGALGVVLLLRSHLAGRGVFTVVFSLPFAYSAASASAIFAGLYAPSVGVINTLLSDVGISGPRWLQDPVTAVFSVALSTAWYEFGFAFLVLTAAVRVLPGEVLEAAQLDGAGGLRLAMDVVVPLLWPTIFFLVVTETITGLQTFAQIQVLTRGGPGSGTTNFVYRLYQLAFGNGTPDFGSASAVAVVLVLVVAVITAAQFRVFGRERTS